MLKRLLAQAGLASQVRRVVPLAGGWTNRNSVIELEDGSRYLLRQYRWPHQAPDLESAQPSPSRVSLA